MIRCSSPASASAGRTCVQQRAEDVGGRGRASGQGVDEVAGEPGAAGPPAGHAQDGRGDGGRRRARPRIPGGGLDQSADEPGQGDGVLDAQRDIGGADLDGRPLLRQAGVEIDHAGVEHGVGGEHVVDQPVVLGGVGEHLVRAGGGPAVPGLGPEAGVAAVGALPERRVGGERGEHRQPDPDPVEDGDALLVAVDGDVHVAAAGQHLAGGEPELRQHAGVALALGRDRLDGDRCGRQRGDVCADGGRGGLGAAAPEAQFRLDLRERVADAGAELDLLGLEFGHQVGGGRRVGLLAGPLGAVVLGGVLPLAPAGGDRQGFRPERDGPAVRVDDQEFLFDADGPHGSMIASDVPVRRLDRQSPLLRGDRIDRYPQL